jgi:hypothetical protein
MFSYAGGFFFDLAEDICGSTARALFSLFNITPAP